MASPLCGDCLCEVETPPPPRPPFPVVFLCDLAVMYVIGFWLNKNLKLHTYCVSAKPAFTAIGAGSARLSWLPTFGIPPLVPSRLLKEKDNRIRSGFLGSIDCHIQRAGKKKKKSVTWVTSYKVKALDGLGLYPV